MSVPSDIEIARAAKLKPIEAVAERVGIPDAALLHYGRHIAKLDLGWIAQQADRPNGRLVLVTAINPTPAGEGKTTTTVGLGDGLNRIGKKAVIALREPSLGPCFGMKGGAAGGGYAQVVPMEQINLHFTGDFHAIGSAHNLLAAMLDNHIYWGNALGLDERRIAWRRAIDMNDRSLRQIVSSLGGVANGFPREDGFDITVASEVMAVFCLATGLEDLEQRLGKMIVGYTRDRKPVLAADLQAAGAMTVLLKDALAPNLVQTLEGNPGLRPWRPVRQHRPWLQLGDGDPHRAQARRLRGHRGRLRRRPGGREVLRHQVPQGRPRRPTAAVIVATVRALKMHGGVAKDALGKEDLTALKRGMANLDRHVRNVRKFGVPVGGGDQPLRHRHRGRARADPRATAATSSASRPSSASTGPRARPAPRRWPATWSSCARRRITATAAASSTSTPTRCRSGTRCAPSRARSTAPRTSSPTSGCATSSRSTRPPATATSRSASPRPSTASRPTPTCKGAPSGHVVPIRELRLAGGAEFLVVICGEIMTMPGLPKTPAAERIRLDAHGQIEGLF